ncbi:MAG TPA: hypothetical protein PKC60_13590 [Hydrogenophaga sp.]|uniref:hypothetical protein n=1 Tax=Hydrogenophaga sp. TaxID=1904254 RepID=UPI002CBEE992|nr:hypothetical protein [Hydrogenophaga sp.]HMN94258.1 hypothetical protein [Hydrogenophaga sp.]HMP11030.1 hypothetical protein [Hydrogenophaga sp.]
MTALLWGVAALLATGWSLFIWAAASFTGWLLGAVPAGSTAQLSDAVRQLPAPPVPDVLAPWLSAGWWTALQTLTADLLAWLGPWLPSAATLLGWLTPLAWTTWALGLLPLLALTGLTHWLLSRFGAKATRPGAQPA